MKMTVNGAAREVVSAPLTPLLHVLRDESGQGVGATEREAGEYQARVIDSRLSRWGWEAGPVWRPDAVRVGRRTSPASL